MTARLISVKDDTVTLQVEVKLGGTMLEMEAGIQDAVNAVGTLATREALHRFDTDGAPIEIGAEKWTSKGCLPKLYQTPYGETEVERHVYQRSKGGRTYCPMERDARIVVTSTPRFAMQVSHKFAAGSSLQVRRDLVEADAQALSTTLREQLLRPLVGFNFGWDKPVPWFRFRFEEEEDLKAQRNLFYALLNSILKYLLK